MNSAKSSSWTISWADTALRDLRTFDKIQQKRIIDKMESYIVAGTDPRLYGSVLSGQFAGYWRFRIGDYRAICSLNQRRLTVLVLRVWHRREAYRK